MNMQTTLHMQHGDNRPMSKFYFGINARNLG